MKLLSACCGGYLLGFPAVVLVDAAKAFYELRSQEDIDSPLGCVSPNAKGENVRHMEIEVFDYNYEPGIKATWTQISDKCGKPLAAGAPRYSKTMEFYAGQLVPDDSEYSTSKKSKVQPNRFGYTTDFRLQMDLYDCVPWGNYELTVVTNSTNQGNAMEKVAWEVENGPDEYHIWDTLNTPFFDGYKTTGEGGAGIYTADSGTRNEGDPEAAIPGYAPIPPDGADFGFTTYEWPLGGAEGYYSLMYIGPFPPLTGEDCPNLYPGVDYMGCFKLGDDQVGWTDDDFEPTGSDNFGKFFEDPAEPYRMFDGIDDDGVAEQGVMTIEKCKSICQGKGDKYKFFGLQSAVKCRCGEEMLGGQETPFCGIVDDDRVPEYKYLCSGDSRVLCGTDVYASIYAIDGSPGSTPDPTPDATLTPGPAPVNEPSPTPPSEGFEYKFCRADRTPNKNRIMGAAKETNGSAMTAKYCFDLCSKDATNTHFGTQFGIECFCVNDPNLESINKYVADSSEGLCADERYQCSGDADEQCGGKNAMSVYAINVTSDDTEGATPKPSPTPTPMTSTPTPAAAASTCIGAEGIPGIQSAPSMSGTACCPLTCVTDAGVPQCGGKGCGKLPGGRNDCCIKFVLAGDNCAVTSKAPCFIAPATAIPTTEAPELGPEVPAEGPYTEMECFIDLKDGSRAMEVKMDTTKKTKMSAEICYNMCTQDDPDYEFFGLQFGFECWCSKTFSETAGGDCTMDCSLNADEDCGGYDAILAFKIN